jgi:squalene-associated FAD-dependent desaturase
MSDPAATSSSSAAASRASPPPSASPRADARSPCIEATRAPGGRARSFPDAATGRELDNGQHLVMGCYRETLAFLRTIDSTDGIYFQKDLSVRMVKPGGQRLSLDCPPLPAPLHLAVGLLKMRGLSLLDKAAAMRAGLVLRGEVKRPDDNETCDSWLRRLGQTPTLRNAFWDPMIWGTLNDDPLVSSAAMFTAVLERAFLSTRDASRLGVPKVPLSRLYVDQSLAYLRARGCEVRLGEPVRALDVTGTQVSGVTLKSGETLRADAVIAAVPPHAFLDLLTGTWPAHPVYQDIARLRTSPIVNLWFTTDRAPFSEPFIGLVGGPLHWMFNRSQIEGSVGGEVLLNCTISGARACIDDPPEALQDLLRAELERYFPGRVPPDPPVSRDQGEARHHLPRRRQLPLAPRDPRPDPRPLHGRRLDPHRPPRHHRVRGPERPRRGPPPRPPALTVDLSPKTPHMTARRLSH